jgi:hypothetical protein
MRACRSLDHARTVVSQSHLQHKWRRTSSQAGEAGEGEARSPAGVTRRPHSTAPRVSTRRGWGGLRAAGWPACRGEAQATRLRRGGPQTGRWLRAAVVVCG